MRAIVQHGYGAPDVLGLREIDRPAVADDEVLVKVRAAAIHAGDCFIMRGQPFAVRIPSGLLKPRGNYVPGFDVSGHVEAVGENVASFQPGDAVFGAGTGTCAEYANIAEGTLVPKPDNVTFEQAAAVPTSAVAALRGLRDAGKVQPGQKVLINGASGGVGTFAVQIAKHLGAEVTGVCSTRNVDMVRSIGADHVVDYTQQDFTRAGERYDLILDNVASRSFSDYQRALTPEGVVLPNSGHSGLGYVVKAFMMSFFQHQQGRPFLAEPDKEDLTLLSELVTSGEVQPVIDRTYPLEDALEAFRYLDEGHARGKVVITM